MAAGGTDGIGNERTVINRERALGGGEGFVGSSSMNIQEYFDVGETSDPMIDHSIIISDTDFTFGIHIPPSGIR